MPPMIEKLTGKAPPPKVSGMSSYREAISFPADDINQRVKNIRSGSYAASQLPFGRRVKARDMKLVGEKFPDRESESLENFVPSSIMRKYSMPEYKAALPPTHAMSGGGSSRIREKEGLPRFLRTTTAEFHYARHVEYPGTAKNVFTINQQKRDARFVGAPIRMRHTSSYDDTYNHSEEELPKKMVRSQTGLVTIPATTERFENGWLRRRLPLHIAPLATQLNPFDQEG
jgi:hypothetical protein